MLPLGATSAPTSQSERNAKSAIGGNALRSTSRDVISTRLPERRLHPRARPVQLDVDVVAVRGGVVDLDRLALLVVAGRVRNEPLPAPPGAAVEDQALDAHAARQCEGVALTVGREEQVDQAHGLGPLGWVVSVEVPVDRAALRMQAVV